MRTLQGGLVVVAVLKDWPANELERQLTEPQVGNAIKRMRIPIAFDVPATTSWNDGHSSGCKHNLTHVVEEFGELST